MKEGEARSFLGALTERSILRRIEENKRDLWLIGKDGIEWKRRERKSGCPNQCRRRSKGALEIQSGVHLMIGVERCVTTTSTNNNQNNT